jgi:YidC/Oxa1 family membrane protein insertase
MSKKESRFDAVTILGLILAFLIFMMGQNYMTRRAAEQRDLAEKARQAEEKKQKDEQAKGPGQTAIGSPGSGKSWFPSLAKKLPAAAPSSGAPAPEAAKPEEPEARPAPDVVISGDKLRLTFTAKGATVLDATISEAFIDPRVKQEKGLQLLGEIEKGKRAFGLPVFEIGPPEAERKKERVIYQGDSGVLRSPDARVWTLNEKESGKDFDSAGIRKVVYELLLGDAQVRKVFTVNKAAEHFTCDIVVSNQSKEPKTFTYSLLGLAGVLLDGPPHDPKGSATFLINSELAGREGAATRGTSTDIRVLKIDPSAAEKSPQESRWVSHPENLWGCVKARFYMAMLVSLDPEQLITLESMHIKFDPAETDLRRKDPNIGVLGTRRISAPIAPAASSKADRYALYVGPANESNLDSAEAALGTDFHLSWSIHYCDIGNWQWPRVDWLAGKMMWFFQLLFRVFGNYGIAVILLTVSIKLALHPLQRKMMVSMSKFQKLQPEIKKLQEKYKGQNSAEAKKKMYLEQQDLMAKAGANPVAGCLPMFVQIPVFSALFGIFNHAFEIRGAGFLWIKDLSQQDQLASFGFWPHHLNLLPLIYMVLTILQTRMNPAPKSEDPAQESQRKMMMFMPVVFSLLFYSMPSGLVLYFAASAIFGMLETWYIKKHFIKDIASGPVDSAGIKTINHKPPPAVIPNKG